MNTPFTLVSLWPHVLLIGFLAIMNLRIRSRTALIFLALGLSVTAVWVYWQLENGIAPPRETARAGQLVALGVASFVPLLAAAVTGHTLKENGVKEHTQVAGAALVGLVLVFFMPGFQMFFGCSFTGLCP
jgi:hypothetical protein